MSSVLIFAAVAGFEEPNTRVYSVSPSKSRCRKNVKSHQYLYSVFATVVSKSDLLLSSAASTSLWAFSARSGLGLTSCKRQRACSVIPVL